MKKIVLLIALLYCMALPCFAAAGDLTVSDATAEAGEMVYLTVTLNKRAVGNTMGISYTYDENVLAPVPESSSWSADSVLEDFNRKGAGVWAGEKSVNLKGEICVLAFQVLPGANLTKTTVSCTVTVKQDADEVGTYTAKATISARCDHQFGGWHEAGNAGHSCTCTKCGVTRTEPHSWDRGVTSSKPGDSNVEVVTYTCQICGYTRGEEHSSGGSLLPERPTESTEHGHTLPTNPEKPTAPTAETKPLGVVEKHTEPTETRPKDDKLDRDHAQNNETVEPTTEPYKDYNKHEDPTEATDEHGHVIHNDNIAPTLIPSDPHESTAQDHEGHDHTTDRSSTGSILATIGFVVALTGGAIYFVKKKR